VAEHVAPALYFLQVHLLVATLVALGAWVLTMRSRASATAKLWIWTATSLNFVLPLGGFVDGFGARDLPGAQQLVPLASLDLTLAHHLKVVTVAAGLYLGGAMLLLLRLWRRIRAERGAEPGRVATDAPQWRVEGVPVHFTRDTGPAVAGILYSRICLPQGIEQLLTAPELEAVLLHEITHARRRDNLLRLVHEVVQCLLWFHPLVWLVGARVALYRELSCDESVLQRSRGGLLVSALAKLALHENTPVLRSAATALVSERLERLLAPALPAPRRLANIVAGAAFVGLLLGGTLFTVAHTACCLVPVR
jgi:beta-lactamase regulating signal transducer with metallopeptidase domain